MKDEPPAPFETVGDEAVEARIVAWVLGEASTFEAAELERLCEERPELMVFHRRMEALHGLLGEAMTAKADAAWKIAPTRRKALDEVVGAEIVATEDAKRERRIHKAGLRSMFAIAACVMFAVVLFQWVRPMWVTQTVVHAPSRTVDFMPSSGVGGEAAGRMYARKPDVLNDLFGFRNPAPDDRAEFTAKESSAGRGEAASKSKTNLSQEIDGLSEALGDQQAKVEKRTKEFQVAAAPKGTVNRGNDSYYYSDSKGDDAVVGGPEEANGHGNEATKYADAERGLAVDQERLQAMRSQLSGRFSDTPFTRKGADLETPMRPEASSAPVPAAQPAPAIADSRFDSQGINAPAAPPAMKPASAITGQREALSADLPALVESTPPSGGAMGGFGMQAGMGGGGSGGGGGGSETMSRSRQVQLGLELPMEENAPQTQTALAGGRKSDLGRASGGRDSSDFASPVDGISVAGIPMNPAGNGISNGLRSGDTAINRNSIDAILNNPNRVVPGQAESATAGRDITPARLAASDAAPPPVLNGRSPSGPAEPSRGWSGSASELKKNLSSGVRESGAGPSQPKLPEGGTYAGLASREMMRRSQSVSDSDKLLMEGRDAYSKGDYAEAAGKYQQAAERLPDAPLLEDRKKSVSDHLNDANVALAMRYRKVGKYPEAQKLLGGVIAKDPENAEAKRELGYIEDPIRTNGALTLTDEDTGGVNKVRRGLYMAEGNFNLGKFDDAKLGYEDVLRTDPNNRAARHGMEQVETAKSDYYRAAYDHTRAELLSKVDQAWELKDQTEAAAKPGTPPPVLGPGKGREMPYPTEIETPVDYAKPDLSDADVAVEPQKADTGSMLGSSIVPLPQDLTDEIVTSENPYSTFSLNISDASFQIARAALAKGEQPDPNSIKVEQFYNAVDYGDPPPVAGQPVAATIDESSHPLIPGRDLVRVSLRTASTGRSAAQPLSLTLLVDQSGSMVREDRRTAMEQAVRQLAGLLTPADRITVIGFSRTPRLLADGMTGDQAGKLDELINQTASEGGTNLEEAMKLGEKLAVRHFQANAQNRIVLFTDGAANLGNADPERLADLVKGLRQKGFAFDIAGIGADGLNDRLLGDLVRHGNGRYYVVGDATNQSFARQLAGAFRPAAENVKVQVNFNPQRVGRYKLIGFEKDRLKTEDFRNDAVDAAELAADEAGVAIYQVETLPSGEGGIGEVSVRFKDTASGEMVERSWTIPFESAPPAFDRSVPAMKLAVLSMLAGEKLHGGPLAAQIDFTKFTAPAAEVKQFYGNSERVADMLRVIDSLK